MTWESETRGGEDIHMRKEVAVVMGNGLVTQKNDQIIIYIKGDGNQLSIREGSFKKEKTRRWGDGVTG